MATINFADLTIPTPEPYSEDEPFKSLADLCYVCLQLFQLGKAAEFSLNDTELAEAIKALAFNGEELDLGDFIVRLTGKTTTLLGI